MGVAHVEPADRAALAGPAGRPVGPARSRCAGARRQCTGVAPGTPGSGPSCRRRSATTWCPTSAVHLCILAPIYRSDISVHTTRPESTDRHAGTRHPRTAEGAAAPRLRAEEAPRRDARLALGHLVRLALSGAAPARARRRIEIVEPETVARAPMPATGSLDGDLAAARLRRPAKATRRTRKAYRITARGDARFSRAAPRRRRRRRRRAHVRVEARVLPPPRPPTRASSSSSAAAPRSPTGSRAPAARRPAAATATPGRSSSTAPSPPSATSSGSTR